MTTLMQKVLAYFAKREGQWYSRQVMRYLHRTSRRELKKYKPMIVVRTYPNGVQEKMSMRLYKGKFRVPVKWLSEHRQKDGKVHLADGSTVEVTKPKKSKGKITLQGMNIAWQEMDEL